MTTNCGLGCAALRVVTVGLAVLLHGAFCLSQTTISLSVGSGPPTTKVQVSGSGFPVNAAVNIYFDGGREAVATANGSGSFSGVTIRVPSSALPGDHAVKATPAKGGASAHAKFLVRTDWAEFHRSNMRRWNQYENVINTGNVGTLQLKWSYATPFPVICSPSVAKGIVYIASEFTLYALDAATGHQLWSYAAGSNFYNSPTVVNGVVYFASREKVYALNATTGKVIWTDTFSGGGNWFLPIVADGVVYVSENGLLYALDANTGATLWSDEIGTGGHVVESSPAVVNGVLYVGSGDGNVYALDAKTGAVIWIYAMRDYSYSSPAVADGVVYIGSRDSSVYALDATTGALVWNSAISSIGGIGSSPAVADGVVYIGSYPANNVYAFNATTGVLVWDYINNQSFHSSPAVANGVVYVGSLDFNLYAFDASTGTLLWNYMTGGQVISSPIVADGVVYAGSGDGKVYAFGLPGGAGRATP